MAKDKRNISIFAMGRSEMKAMIGEHMANLEMNLQLVKARQAQLEKEGEQDVEREFGTKVTTVLEILGNAADALANQIRECEWQATHLAPEAYFQMTAAELLAFRKSYGNVTINVDRMVLTAMTAPEPDRQAERHLYATMVEVPRLILPGGIAGLE